MKIKEVIILSGIYDKAELVIESRENKAEVILERDGAKFSVILTEDSKGDIWLRTRLPSIMRNKYGIVPDPNSKMTRSALKKYIKTYIESIL